MKWGEAEIWLQQQLIALSDQRESAAIASVVMENITGCSRAERLSKKEDRLNVHQLHRLTEIHQRLVRQEPVQYVLNQAWFYGLPFFVDKNVLIPRPETEELVEWVINDVKALGLNVFDKSAGDADLTASLKILDAGCGSGCIALALKKAMPRAEVWGCDISEEALNVSRRNGSELNIRVDFQGMNFLDPDARKGLPSVDIVVSNPPYIPRSAAVEMKKNVVGHEPHAALFVPDEDPLIFYRALAGFGRHRLHAGGSMYCEIHENRGQAVSELFNKAGYSQVEVRKDMQGKDRMVKILAVT